MEEKPARSMKRPLSEDDVLNKPPMQKRVKFPKGKKVKPGDEVLNAGKDEDVPSELTDPRLAAKERAKHRTQITAELFSEESRGIFHDISAAEVNYEGDENFDDDGIQIEPFNLNQEREEGYFDSEGNFVEYVNEKEIKDAWLDSVDLEPKFDKRNSMVTKVEDDTQDLTTAAIGKIKRRIADLLEPGETVLQALRRLKGTSNNRKEKMSAETKLLFDQLTEDAMKLLENGEFNVYHEKQEVFEREAEGYERLAQAKGEGTSMGAVQGASGSVMERDLFSVTYLGAAASILPETAAGSSNLNGSTTEISNNDNDAFDMFGEDDEPAPANLSSDGGNLATVPNSDMIDQPLSEVQDTSSETGALQNDYVYDESSGYYYSSSLGYYYDPSSGLYCSAASGQWYSFNEETGTYDEIHEVASNTS